MNATNSSQLGGTNPVFSRNFIELKGTIYHKVFKPFYFNLLIVDISNFEIKENLSIDSQIIDTDQKEMD